MRSQWFHANFWQSLKHRLNEVPGAKNSAGIAESVKRTFKLLLPCPMSTTPSQSNEVIANAPSFGNPELFWVDLDVEEEEDPEKIQWEADKCIMAVKIHNEKRWLEWEDQKWNEEKEWKQKEKRPMPKLF